MSGLLSIGVGRIMQQGTNAILFHQVKREYKIRVYTWSQGVKGTSFIYEDSQ